MEAACARFLMNARDTRLNHWLTCLAVLALNLATIMTTNADSSVPNPPGLYTGYTMTQLPDGKWLVAGGASGGLSKANPDEARLYDPASGLWTNTASMTSKRIYHAAALLADGKVLVAGGESGADNSQLSSAEIYNPSSGTWIKTGSMNGPRLGGFQLTVLANGQVLATGGSAKFNSWNILASAELYDPKTGKWSMTTPMNEARYDHAATRLGNGMVLVAGGKNRNADYIFSAEIYNPATGKWTATGSMPYESRFTYTAALRTNGQVLLTATGADYAWELTNAWEASNEIYDPVNGSFAATGPHRPHFVSSKNLDRTLKILPAPGSSFLASEPVEFMVESADRFGVTNIQLLRDDVQIGEGEESPFRCTLTNTVAGTYSFLARASFANGLASTSAPITITFKTSEPQVSLMPGPTEFVSETHVRTSPATLLVSVVGMNPNALVKLTLNGVPQPLQTGNFTLHPVLKEGENQFVLIATDDRGRTGKATTEIYLDSSAPTVSIAEPANHATIDALWVDVHGTFEAKNLKQLIVGNDLGQVNVGNAVTGGLRIPARISGNTFEARNVFLNPGTNTIVAVAEDLAGNAGTNTITIAGPTNINLQTAPVFPVKLDITPAGGFAPLAVTLKVQAHVPGKIQKVFYDFNGDDVSDLTNSDLRPITYTYQTGAEYFPAVTIQTSVGRFSSLAGMMAMTIAMFGGDTGTSFVNVQTPPVLLSTIKIIDPVAVQWTATSNLYVLSGSTATLTEFNATGKTVRSKTGVGSRPSGLAVDTNGNVYVAVTGENQVRKFKPNADSFEIDSNFGLGGIIGNKNGSAGAGSNELNAPFDVALSGNDQTLMISDSGNNRLLEFSPNGTFIRSSQTGGGLQQQFKAPAGLVQDDLGIYLFVVDSGNNRIALSHSGIDFIPDEVSGTNGAALGQFNSAMHLSANNRALYVADTGNNRVQVFSHVEGGEGHSPVPFNPRVALSGELGLNHPKAIAAVNDLLEEKLYIADTGNNRVILVKLPLDNPEGVWNHLIACLKTGDFTSALSDFSIASKDKYQDAFQSMSKDDLTSTVKDMQGIKPVYIENDRAQYYFESVIDGKTLTFPVEFDKEFGQWKVMEY